MWPEGACRRVTLSGVVASCRVGRRVGRALDAVELLKQQAVRAAKGCQVGCSPRVRMVEFLVRAASQFKERVSGCSAHASVRARTKKTIRREKGSENDGPGKGRNLMVLEIAIFVVAVFVGRKNGLTYPIGWWVRCLLHAKARLLRHACALLQVVLFVFVAVLQGPGCQRSSFSSPDSLLSVIACRNVLHPRVSRL